MGNVVATGSFDDLGSRQVRFLEEASRIRELRHTASVRTSGDLRGYLELENMLFFEGYVKAFAMGGGPCSLCDECSVPCVHPKKARPSMEACGIDVYSTAKAHGFPIEVLKTKTDSVNFYGLVLIE